MRLSARPSDTEVAV